MQPAGFVSQASLFPAASGVTQPPSTATSSLMGIDELLPLVTQLTDPDKREIILLELSKKAS
jgi:hypothetical protein